MLDLVISDPSVHTQSQQRHFCLTNLTTTTTTNIAADAISYKYITHTDVHIDMYVYICIIDQTTSVWYVNILFITFY